MSAAPMLADFAIRFAFGLAVSILMISWRAVPLPFFRIQAHVILGLLVLAALDQARAAGSSAAFWAVVVAAVLAYLSAVAWGLGLPRFGRGTAALAALTTASWLAVASWPASAGLGTANACSRLSSGFLLGATLTAMLLGHYYLTAPAMTIEPLKRVVLLMAWGLGARCLLAAIGMWAAQTGALGGGPAPIDPRAGIFLAVRWGMGLGAAALSMYLAWKTAEMRSTQSATGILYITMIFVLFGELTSLVLAGRDGVICQEPVRWIRRYSNEDFNFRHGRIWTLSGHRLYPPAESSTIKMMVRRAMTPGRGLSAGRKVRRVRDHGADVFVSEMRRCRSRLAGREGEPGELRSLRPGEAASLRRDGAGPGPILPVVHDSRSLCPEGLSPGAGPVHRGGGVRREYRVLVL